MVTIPFVREIDVAYGRCDRLSPLIRRVIANNPGPFTYTGTGTYIIGTGSVAVIDPGPLLDEHFEALKAALASETVSHILITHTHIDHSPLAGPLKAWCGAPTYGFGPHGAGARRRFETPPQGGDMTFVQDVTVADGDVIKGAGWSMECVHTPGHTSNHMSFALREENALFCGDMIMGWSTPVVSPPDGDMADYFRSLHKLLARSDGILWPTHGPAVTEPRPLIEAFLAHRMAREDQIAACLADGLARIPDMVAHMYRDVDPGLHPAAERSVFAHLLHMVEDGRAATDGEPQPDSDYRAV